LRATDRFSSRLVARQLPYCAEFLADVVEYDGYLDAFGTFTTIDVPGAETHPYGINSRGQIVGTFSSQTGVHGFVYDSGTFTTYDVPGAIGGTFPHGINSSGQIVGTILLPATGGHGFVDSGGTLTLIDVPGAVNSGTR